jgi:hypothetical protein
VDEDENEPAPSLARRPDCLPHLLTNFLLLPLSLDEMKTTRTRIPVSQTLTHSDADTLSKQKIPCKMYSKLLLTKANNKWPSRSIREPEREAERRLIIDSSHIAGRVGNLLLPLPHPLIGQVPMLLKAMRQSLRAAIIDQS